jgi:response regulator RpfG family c-di-GMP phosphodiesterase
MMAKQPTLLFVDDEPNILRSLRRTFRGLEYEILLANSGAEGLKILADGPVDLIISDMRMPEMDGAQFLAKVYEKYPDTIRILLTGYADIKSTVDAVNKGGIHKYLNKPWDDAEIKSTVEQALDLLFIKRERDELLIVVQKQNLQLTDLNKNLENKVAERTKDLIKAMESVNQTNNELKASYINIVKTFSSLIEMKKLLRKTSSRAVSELAKLIAHEMELKNEDIQTIMIAAMLYKVGKVTLRDDLLRTPFMDLDNKYMQEFLQHAVVGQGILMGISALQAAARMIRHQHERFDGKGFPDNLQGSAISPAQSCLIIAIEYYELMAGNIYHVKMSPPDAVDWIVQGAGKRFSPDVVVAFQMAIDAQITKQANQEVECPVSGLENGMILSRDVITDGGMLILSKGQVLDGLTIEKLIQYEQSLKCGLKAWVNPNKTRYVDG